MKKLYRDMTPQERERADKRHERAMQQLKKAAELRME